MTQAHPAQSHGLPVFHDWADGSKSFQLSKEKNIPMTGRRLVSRFV